MWQGACGIGRPADGIVSPAYRVSLRRRPVLNSAHLPYHWFKSRSDDPSLLGLFAWTDRRSPAPATSTNSLKFRLAPANPEQQRHIVAVLDAWDRAIDQTERLIAVKRRRKKALFKSCSRNLPKRPLLEAARCLVQRQSTRKSRAERSARDRSAIIWMCFIIRGSRAKTRLHACDGFSSQIASNSLRKHDVVFTKDSETSEEIA